MLALIGPENFQPPLPGLNTPEGTRALLGILTVMVFIPAAIGTTAITSEYRHKTITFSFLFAPRRWKLLTAKLTTYTLVGICYGLVLAVTAGIGLYAGTSINGATVGLPTATVLDLLLRLAAAMAVYMVLGVGIGALIPHQVAALVVVIGYLYVVEIVLLAIPGVNAIYPYLPGGATAALTNFTYLGDAVAQQSGSGGSQLLSTSAGALLLAAYTLIAAALAIAVPLRRDVT
jgi:ABC-type transport system involved in multi-copper enzyme maturation permease subunit